MKNLPTVAKFLTILGIFGLFVIGATIYVTTEMRGLTAGFERVGDTSATAALDITTANQALDGAEADIEWLLIANTPAGIQSALGKPVCKGMRQNGTPDVTLLDEIAVM